jgi:hypothetical protein
MSPLVTVVRFVALLLVGLGLAPGAAHAMELPQKMGYDGPLYTAVTSTLYRYFGLVGGPVQVGGLVATVVLCALVRRRGRGRGFGWTLAAAGALAVSLALWGALVAPVNAEWGRVLHADPSAAAAAYLRLRPRWEYGHVAAFVAWVAGFACLVISVLVEVPRERAVEWKEK